MHRGMWKSSFSPESRGCSGRALWKVHCGAWHRAWQSSWVSSLSCGDRAGVLPAPAVSVVVAVGCTVLQTWRGDVPWALQVRVSHIYVRQR